MKKIILGWDDDGKWNTTVTVEGGRIVRIEQPRATPTSKPESNGIIRPSPQQVQQYSKKYAGDYVAAGLSKMGVKPCRGCN